MRYQWRATRVFAGSSCAAATGPHVCCAWVLSIFFGSAGARRHSLSLCVGGLPFEPLCFSSSLCGDRLCGIGQITPLGVGGRRRFETVNMGQCVTSDTLPRVASRGRREFLGSPKHFRKGGPTIDSLHPREQDSFCNTEEKVGGKASGRDGCTR